MAVVVETTLGDFTVDLYTEDRPHACKNFLKLCKIKYYNFCLFHTVQHNFIAQTGDPTGSGKNGESIFGKIYGEEKRFFEAETMPKIKHTRSGLLSMVNCGNNMLGSQFFITLGSELQSLDNEHCIFGEISEGHEILLKLNDVICDSEHRPYQDIRITHTVILEDPFDDPPDLVVPDASPEPSKETLLNSRIAPDEELDETKGKSAAELEEIAREQEAKAQATILEIVGDLPDADVAPPENVLFVCKLNPVTTDDDLEIIFSRFGKVKSCEVIRDRVTGDSLQYAFVEFEEQKACEDAFFKMDNVLIDDRRIHVDFSQSVSKLRWKGKGRGVEHLDGDANKTRDSFKSKSAVKEHKQLRGDHVKKERSSEPSKDRDTSSPRSGKSSEDKARKRLKDNICDDVDDSHKSKNRKDRSEEYREEKSSTSRNYSRFHDYKNKPDSDVGHSKRDSRVETQRESHKGYVSPEKKYKKDDSISSHSKRKERDSTLEEGSTSEKKAKKEHSSSSSSYSKKHEKNHSMAEEADSRYENKKLHKTIRGETDTSFEEEYGSHSSYRGENKGKRSERDSSYQGEYVVEKRRDENRRLPSGKSKRDDGHYESTSSKRFRDDKSVDHIKREDKGSKSRSDVSRDEGRRADRHVMKHERVKKSERNEGECLSPHEPSREEQKGHTSNDREKNYQRDASSDYDRKQDKKRYKYDSENATQRQRTSFDNERNENLDSRKQPSETRNVSKRTQKELAAPEFRDRHQNKHMENRECGNGSNVTVAKLLDKRSNSTHKNELREHKNDIHKSVKKNKTVKGDKHALDEVPQRHSRSKKKVRGEYVKKKERHSPSSNSSSSSSSSSVSSSSSSSSSSTTSSSSSSTSDSSSISSSSSDAEVKSSRAKRRKLSKKVSSRKKLVKNVRKNKGNKLKRSKKKSKRQKSSSDESDSGSDSSTASHKLKHKRSKKLK